MATLSTWNYICDLWAKKIASYTESRLLLWLDNMGRELCGQGLKAFLLSPFFSFSEYKSVSMRSARQSGNDVE